MSCGARMLGRVISGGGVMIVFWDKDKVGIFYKVIIIGGKLFRSNPNHYFITLAEYDDEIDKALGMLKNHVPDFDTHSANVLFP